LPFRTEPRPHQYPTAGKEQIDLLFENAVIAENNKTFALSHGYNDPKK
jgi:hypothetical protein